MNGTLTRTGGSVLVVLALHAMLLVGLIRARFDVSVAFPQVPIEIDLPPAPETPKSEPREELQENPPTEAPEPKREPHAAPPANPIVQAPLPDAPKAEPHRDPPTVQPRIKPKPPTRRSAPVREELRPVPDSVSEAPVSAPPASVADAAPAATAPIQAGPPASRSAPPTWVGRIMQRLERFKRYPYAARAAHQEGIVLVRFTLARDGSVLSSDIVKSSGSELLDNEARELPERAGPLPAPRGER
jgi:periplasmic protein TonB